MRFLSDIVARSSDRMTMREIRRCRASFVAIVVGLASLLMGCSSDIAGIDHPDQALLWITVNIPAVTLATEDGFDTVRLSAEAYRGDGTVLSDLPIAYKASDKSIVVTSDGLVTAVNATINSYVVSSATYQGVTRTDTTWITVLDTIAPAPLQTFSMVIDSNLAAGMTTSVQIIAQDTNHWSRSDIIPVRFSISNTAIAQINRYGVLTTVTPQQSITIWAKTLYLGKEFLDSANISIGYPALASIQIAPRRTITGEVVLEFAPNVIQIAAGGVVSFINMWADIPNTKPMDVVFETPEAVHAVPDSWLPTGEGNIPLLLRTDDNPLGVISVRLFSTPGTYRFSSTHSPSTGTIIVR